MRYYIYMQIHFTVIYVSTEYVSVSDTNHTIVLFNLLHPVYHTYLTLVQKSIWQNHCVDWKLQVSIFIFICFISSNAEVFLRSVLHLSLFISFLASISGWLTCQRWRTLLKKHLQKTHVYCYKHLSILSLQNNHHFPLSNLYDKKNLWPAMKLVNNYRKYTIICVHITYNNRKYTLSIPSSVLTIPFSL